MPPAWNGQPLRRHHRITSRKLPSPPNPTTITKWISRMSELVAHQFDDLEQQTEADTLGMWTFLATEVLFFGGMICGYCVYRLLHFTAWHEGSLIVDNFRWLGISSGAWNTAVLLTSSLSVAMGVRAAKMGNNSMLCW